MNTSGVQDMACDTFLKIAQKCKRKFMTTQTEETQPFILSLIADLGRHIKDLQPHQVQSFYESVACMLSDKGPAITIPREEVIVMLMEIPNLSWRQVTQLMRFDVIRCNQLKCPVIFHFAYVYLFLNSLLLS